ncbi:hypothetical protein [Microbacterium dauci]|uniref:Uncharacterized protein n=1 Tax=Microbacterium dauci TaxID=3048008 RepID=A0ABT6ZG41_9MICO|nr:hypothetical protein [Microbacterium sp. LX3-4]MDJ1114602.1 hypothetical protein [Microbacterium sp. LX3-4]
MTTGPAAELIEAIVEHLRGAPDEWDALALVIELRGDRVATTYGYVYQADGTTAAVASRPSGVLSTVRAYLAATYEAGQRLPLKLLVQFERITRAYEITFEDSDAARWKVTPGNIDVVPHELRPDFVRRVMTLDELLRTVAEERLDTPVLSGAGVLHDDAVVLERRGDHFVVFLVNERHAVIESTLQTFDAEDAALAHVLRKLRQVARARRSLEALDRP